MARDVQDFFEALKESSSAIETDHRVARQELRFAVGGEGQWENTDLEKLRKEQRPALTINQVKPIIEAVSGSEIVNRFEPRFSPRSPSMQDIDSFVADGMGDVYKWARQQSDVEHHESRAFKNTVSVGRGFLHTFMDYSDSPWGKIMTQWVPLFEVATDPNAKHMNMKDQQYIIRGKWMPQEDFSVVFPDVDIEKIRASSIQQQGTALYSGYFGRHSVVGGTYDPSAQESVISGWYDSILSRILVYEWQYTYKEVWTRVFMPPGAQVAYQTDAEDVDGARVVQGASWIPTDEREKFLFTAQEESGMDVATVEQIDLIDMPRQRYRRKMVSATEELEDGLIAVDDFTIQAITGFADESGDERQIWRGLVFDMKDPQRITNKTLSQIIYLMSLNPNAILAEEDTFVDRAQAESDLSNPSKIVTVRRNAISQGRIKDKLGRSPIPAGMEAILSFAIEAVPQTAGISPYFSGQVADLKRTPASAVQSVQRQTMMILSTLMDSLRLHRKDHARLVMKFVQEYLPEEQINRVLRPELREMGVANLIVSKDVAEYDIVVDESPTTPTAQAEFRQDMMQSGFITQLLDMGVPFPPELFGFMGLPATIAQKWAAMYQKMLDQPPQPPEGETQ